VNWEKRGAQLVPLGVFMRRLATHFAVALALLLGSLAIGMAGYARFERLTWLDAFLNSAMLLGGMGPVDLPKTDAGKLFAGIYALYAGVLFLVLTAILLAPVFHRVLHHFHFADEDSNDE
jgi:hypothetical protein